MTITKLLPIFLILGSVHSDSEDPIPPTSSDCPLSYQELYPTCQNWSSRKFDFIIVGAGTAGCTLANRLTENSDWNVLLLESGGVPSNLSEIPALYYALQKSQEDWQYHALSNDLFTGYINQECNWAKGKVLGGSSTINAMVTVPGVPSDYDYWAYLGNEDWNWNNVTKYFDRVWGQIGRVTYKSPDPMRDHLAKAVEELGIDPTGFSQFRYGDVPMQTINGQRNSHAKAYLSPIKDRPNLCVVTGIQVTSLWFDLQNTLQGVQINETHIKAEKEVILSAGAMETPKLLMLSGIGPKDHLQTLGVPLKVDLPVGQNLIDHMYVPIIIQNTTTTTTTSPELQQSMNNYCADRTDLNNIGVTNYQGYINPQNSTTQNQLFHRPTVELIHVGCPPQEPMLSIVLNRVGFLQSYQDLIKDLNQNNYIQIIYVELLHPKSKGYLQLNSTSPFDKPLIYPEYLTKTKDIETLLAGIEFIKNLTKTQSLQDFKIIDLKIPHCPKFDQNSEEYWKCYFKTFVATIYHPGGTCMMGNKSTKSVVNSRMQVWEVPKLRVVDTSVFPGMVTGHTNIPCGMVAEKAADYIKEDYSDLSKTT